MGCSYPKHVPLEYPLVQYDDSVVGWSRITISGPSWLTSARPWTGERVSLEPYGCVAGRRACRGLAGVAWSVWKGWVFLIECVLELGLKLGNLGSHIPYLSLEEVRHRADGPTGKGLEKVGG